jgi:small conductance mechanosensitive channel
MLMKRLEPGTAGTIGFLIRLAALAATILVALRLAGLKHETLAVGGAITAVILGYTTLANGADRIMIPNNVVLAAAVVRCASPRGVDLVARLEAYVKPSEVDRVLREGLSVETRSEPEVELEEMDGQHVMSTCGPPRRKARMARSSPTRSLQRWTS